MQAGDAARRSGRRKHTPYCLRQVTLHGCRDQREIDSRSTSGTRRATTDTRRPGAPSLLRVTVTDVQTGESYNGADLQFLPALGPFPYGLSPFGFGYNYYKRAQLLQEAGKQRHSQLSDLVIDYRSVSAVSG